MLRPTEPGMNRSRHDTVAASPAYPYTCFVSLIRSETSNPNCMMSSRPNRFRDGFNTMCSVLTIATSSSSLGPLHLSRAEIVCLS